jgi:putative copper resistance protein D
MLFQLFDFLATLFDTFQLAAQAWVIGGVAFALLVASPLGDAALKDRARLWISRGALVSVAAEAISLLPPVTEMVTRLDLPLSTALSADFVLWHLLAIVATLALSLLARGQNAIRQPLLLLAPVLVMLLAAVMTSHAASRIDGRLVLGLFHVTHVTAASVWVGGIPFLLMSLATAGGGGRLEQIGPLARRYSVISATSVGLLTISAIWLTATHVNSLSALVGGEYGALVLVKIAMFACMLLLGLGNLIAGRSLESDGGFSKARLKSFAETEIGLACAVLLVAASISGQPPPIDLPGDIVPAADMWERIRPITWPRLWDPPVITTITWSETNHNVSGLFVFVMGFLALLYHTGRCDWAKHWPLIFVGFVWMAIRSDRDSWPMGDCSFFGCGGGDPETIQHRLLTVLPAAFGVIEWMVRTGRLKQPVMKYMFPMICAVGGALLLAHNHQIGDVRERYLVEFTHLPMGLFGILAGWGRWLELRGDAEVKRWAGWFWPVCLMIVGMLLLLYREA